MATAIKLRRIGLGIPFRFADLPAFVVAATAVVFAARIRRKARAVYTFRDLSAIVGCLGHNVLGIPWVADLLDDPALELRNWQQRRRSGKAHLILLALRLQDRLLRRTFKSADLVVTIGSDLGDPLPTLLAEQYRVSRDRILAITNGVDLTELTPEPLALHPPGFTICYVGYVSKMRGLGVLVEVAGRLRDQIPGLRVILTGTAKPADRRWLADAAARAGIEQHIVYLGSVSSDRVIDTVRRADVCVYPFPRRPELDCVYPVKVFEYMALAKPVVASDLTAMRRIIRNGENGLLVEPDDIDSWVAALLAVYRDSALREKLGASARASVQSFDWRAIHRRLDERLAMVLRGAASVAASRSADDTSTAAGECR